MRDPLKNFWRQPPQGYDQDTAGRTGEQLARWEKICGFKLPALYKAQLRLQNGGLPWPQAYVHGGVAECLFINSGELDGIPANEKYCSLDEVYGKEEMEEVLGKDCRLERLYVLSWVDGHNVLCLDYGMTQETPRQEPEVCYFETDGFEEVFRVPSYDVFMERLVYSVACYEGCWHLGIKTGLLSQDVLAEHCARALGIPLKRREDDRYGWFNFDAWYGVVVPEYEGWELRCALSPNRFNAGTWLFPDSREYSFILEIDFEETSDQDVAESRIHLESMVKKLRSDAVELAFLMPE